MLDALGRELAEEKDLAEITAVRVVRRAGRTSCPREVPLDALARGDSAALWLAAADWVFVEDGLLDEVAPYLPSNLRSAQESHATRDALQKDAFSSARHGGARTTLP